MNHILDLYKDAISRGKEFDCFNNKIRGFAARDSFLYHVTDMNVLWEYAILPLYLEGDHELPHRIQSYMKQLLESDDVISIYEAIDCIKTYEGLHRFFNFPIIIDFSKEKSLAIETVRKNKTLLKNDNGEMFRPLDGNAYEILTRMLGLRTIISLDTLIQQYDVHNSSIESMNYNTSSHLLEIDINFCFWKQSKRIFSMPETGIIKWIFHNVFHINHSTNMDTLDFCAYHLATIIQSTAPSENELQLHLIHENTTDSSELSIGANSVEVLFDP